MVVGPDVGPEETVLGVNMFAAMVRVIVRFRRDRRGYERGHWDSIVGIFLSAVGCDGRLWHV